MGARPKASKAKREPTAVRPRSRRTDAAILLALLSLGLLVAGISFLLSRSAGSWWTVPLPALGTYALLLIGLYFKDHSNPLARLIGAVVEAVSSRFWLAATAALLSTTAAAILGYYLIVTALGPDGELRFIVYERGNIEGQRQTGLTMELEHLRGTGQTVSEQTDSRGIARFPVSLGDLVTVRLVRGDGQIYVYHNNRTISKADLDSLSPIDIAKVPAQEWLTRAKVVALGDQVGSLTIDPNLLRWNQGMPSRVVGDPAALGLFTPLQLPGAEIVIAREPFISGFSPALRQPRWVASRVLDGPVGRRGRDRYAFDPLLPAEMQASPGDYTRNLFDRAHLVRRADLGPVFSLSNERNLMTMITPQANVMNQRLWVDLETYTSALKTPRNQVYVLRGPAFAGPRQDQVTLSVLGSSRLPVPTHYFQVALVVEGGRTTAQCHLVPNTTQVGTAARGETPRRFRATLPAIEAVTGLRFFAGMAADERPCARI